MPRIADALHRAPNPPPVSRLRQPLPEWMQRPLGAAALTLGVHALMLLWLLASDRQRLPIAETTALQIEWIRHTPDSLPIPPMPQAPPRSERSRVRSPAVTPVVQAAPESEVAEAAIEPPADPGPARPLSAQMGAFIREQPTGSSFERGPLDRPAQALPGRGEAFVEGFHVREETSPSGAVQAVLGLVGLGNAGGITCADIRRKMVSGISDAERRKLIHDERRICRRGESGTFR